MQRQSFQTPFAQCRYICLFSGVKNFSFPFIWSATSIQSIDILISDICRLLDTAFLCLLYPLPFLIEQLISFSPLSTLSILIYMYITFHSSRFSMNDSPNVRLFRLNIDIQLLIIFLLEKLSWKQLSTHAKLQLNSFQWYSIISYSNRRTYAVW